MAPMKKTTTEKTQTWNFWNRPYPMSSSYWALADFLPSFSRHFVISVFLSMLKIFEFYLLTIVSIVPNSKHIEFTMPRRDIFIPSSSKHREMNCMLSPASSITLMITCMCSRLEFEETSHYTRGGEDLIPVIEPSAHAHS